MSRHQPTAFISSTVYDFEDLRSSLRYWLEERGYRVQVSEFADFDAPPGLNSYEACFAAIRASDVFVLLIGGRRGGWYDLGQRVTITQQEYRVAYECARSGSLWVLPFVRQGISDRMDFYRRLSDRFADHDACRQLLAQATEPINDPEHLALFLREVGRVDEMVEATGGETARPVNNWLRRFASFRDISSALEVALGLNMDVPTRLILDLACDELLEFARSCATRVKDVVYFCCDFVPSVMREIRPDIELITKSPTKRVTITSQQASRLLEFAMGFTLRYPLPFWALERVCVAGSLAEVDPISRLLRPSRLQKSAQDTYRAILEVSHRAFLDVLSEQKSAFLSDLSQERRSEDRDVGLLPLIALFSASLRVGRAIAEIENFVGHVRHGHPLRSEAAATIPVTPFFGEEERLDEEMVSAAEVADLLKRQNERMCRREAGSASGGADVGA